MRIAAILTLVTAFCAWSAAARADLWHPSSWLGCCRDKAEGAKTTNVSQTTSTPAAFSKLTSGTKRLASNTKNLFVARKPPAKKLGVTATRRAERPQPPKQNFFKRWFNPEPPPPPQTVDEWMSLEQVHP
jgi:hypothetical protein